MTSEIKEERLVELRDAAEWSIRMGISEESILPNRELISLINEVIFRRVKEDQFRMDEEYRESC